MRLEKKIAIITGGATGIGKATAERFAEEGACVIVWDINEDLGQKTIEYLNNNLRISDSPAHKFFKVNVADRKAVQECTEDVISEFKKIDILVNNAGLIRDSTLVKVKDGKLVKQMMENDFDIVISVNLKGVFNCTQAVSPYMINQQSGVILNATSVAALDGNFGQTNYVASKSGIIGMTKVWSRELGRYNIRVNAVAPGPTETEMVKSMPTKVLEYLKEHTPLGRLAKPSDIANVYLFLASDEAGFINGTALRVDGGLVVGT